MHVHVLSADGEAKFWLEPEIKLAKNHGYSRSQLKLVESMVEEQSPGHFYWPDIDVDLTEQIIEHPKRYPLVTKSR